MLKNIQNHKYYPLLLYVSCLLITLFSINYFSYLNYSVSGVHLWRQADSISFAAYYYENGMNFFEPGTYCLECTNGRAVSEFPILYYITAALWFIFGRHDIVLKLIDSLIVFTGFYCLFKIAYQQIGNIYNALLITFLLLSSSVLLFYSNNFLPDLPSLGFGLIGTYFIFQYIHTKRYKFFIVAFAFFTLSVLLKITLGIIPLSIIGLLVFEKIFKIKINSVPIFTQKSVRYFLPVIAMVVITGCWVLWVIHYNKLNNCTIFLTDILPYWQCTPRQVTWIVNQITHYWFPHYYFYSTIHFLIAIIILGILNITKWNRLNILISLFVIVGSICYGLLFFRQLGVHDYYMIPFFIPLSLIIIFSFNSFSNRFLAFKKSIIPTLGLLIITCLSLNYAKGRLEGRFITKNWAKLNENIKGLSGKLETYGVPKNAAIFSIPDCTPNATLYYLQRKGYTNWGSCKKSAIHSHLKNVLGKGVEYIIISQADYYQFANSNWFKTKQVGQYKNIKMYKVVSIDSIKWNKPINP